jgi:Flp pilus assembly protein TadB
LNKRGLEEVIFKLKLRILSRSLDSPIFMIILYKFLSQKDLIFLAVIFVFCDWVWIIRERKNKNEKKKKFENFLDLNVIQ